MFSAEGNPTSLNIRASMKDPKYFNIACYISLMIIFCTWSFVGTIGWIAYGNEIEDVITLNLPLNNYTIFIRLLYCLCLLGSYPIQMIAPIDIIEQSDIYTKIPNLEWLDLRFYVVRTVLVLFTGVLALIIPKIALFINFTGAIGGTFAWLIFPVIIYQKVFQGQLNILEIAINWFILAFATIFGGITIFVTFTELVELLF